VTTATIAPAATDHQDATPDVYGLSYGELAIVLYAADVATRALRRTLDRIALIEWATQGLAVLGRDLVWWTDYRSRHIGGRLDRATTEMRAEYDRLWPDARRAQAAWDAAGRITRQFGPDPRPWPGTDTRTVTLRQGAFSWPVPVRDLEFAARYPARAEADPQLSAHARAYAARTPNRPGEAA
jgi:hypothetical protein